MKRQSVAVSGGFDPLHPGHLEFFRRARSRRELDCLTVIVEPDEFVAKKHPVLMPQEQRAKVVGSVVGVDRVLLNRDPDSCAEMVIRSGAHVYAVGKDHENLFLLPEYNRLTEAGIKILVVDTPKQSSSEYIRRVQQPVYTNPIPAVTAIVQCQGRILIQKRRDNGKWELPGGFVEVGESHTRALRRELQEELGLTDIPGLFYLSSSAGVYRDGRPIVVGCWRAQIFADARDKIQPATEEVRCIEWIISEPTDGREWDNETDLKFLREWMVMYRG